MIARLLLVVILTCSVTSCSPLSALSVLGIGGKPGIAVDAQVGDREAKIGDSIQGTGDITAETVEVVTAENEIQAQEVIIENGPKPWVILLLILGWVLPTPNSMFNKLSKR